MANRRIFFGFLAIIFVMMVAAVVLIILPAIAGEEFRPSPRVITDTEEVTPFLLTESVITGVLAHFDHPCLIVHFPVNATEAANLDAGIRAAAKARNWDLVETGPGTWRLTRITDAELGQPNTQGSEELRLRHEPERARVVLGWFRAENTSLPLAQTPVADYVTKRFWPAFANPDALTF